MAFTTKLHIADDCSGTRLRSLVRSLQRVDCLVQLEPAADDAGGATVARLAVRVPADGYTWIVRGGLRTLIAAYPDVVRGHGGFEEISERGGHAPSLPGGPQRERTPRAVRARDERNRPCTDAS